MPANSVSISVSGTTRTNGALVLSERLDGYDTFLSGQLTVGTADISVRILTFDDVTVLRPMGADESIFIPSTWRGVLHISHGLRSREVPADLAQEVSARRRDLTALSEAELRYALTFLRESTTHKVRRSRIDAIASALPVVGYLNEGGMLITIDVGGTLGDSAGIGLSQQLVAASPLEPATARRIMRSRLHTIPELSDAVFDDLCRQLEVDPVSISKRQPASKLIPRPTAIDVVRELSYYGTVVTLSNVTCLDADTDDLRRVFSPWITDQFPSCHIGYAKPDPRAFHYVAQKFGVGIERVIHIGDSWECDAAGAVDAGARAIWISGGAAAPFDTREAREDILIVEHLPQVVALVQSIARSAA